jgi:hypothetical protein
MPGLQPAISNIKCSANNRHTGHQRQQQELTISAAEHHNVSCCENRDSQRSEQSHREVRSHDTRLLLWLSYQVANDKRFNAPRPEKAEGGNYSQRVTQHAVILGTNVPRDPGTNEKRTDKPKHFLE